MPADHHHEPGLAAAQAVRAEALEGLLIDKGILTESEVDHFIQTWSERIGPMIGARVVARAWVDNEFRRRLATDATAAVRDAGTDPGRLERLEVVFDEPGIHNVVCCTLCSCYPWTLLGLPPAWYKSPEYRSRIVREPRVVLAEMGLELDEDTTVQVWDSSSEVRYLVVPERPPGTEGMTADELAELVSRDSMIGVARPRSPADPGLIDAINPANPADSGNPADNPANPADSGNPADFGNPVDPADPGDPGDPPGADGPDR